MGLSVADKLATGRMIATRKAPYFRAMITSLVPYETREIPTIGVTAKALLPYNPDWIAQRSQDEMGALYWHEVMHLVLDHMGRRGQRDPTLWNIAGDIFINDQGRSTLQLVFPPGGMFPELFGFQSNLSADEYYSLLLQMGKEAAAQRAAKGQKDGDWQSGQCGSGAGNPMKGEPDDQGKVGGRSESEVQQTRMQVAEQVRDHCAKNGGGRGNLPLGMDRWAEDMARPSKVPWRAILARTLRQAVAYAPGSVDFSFSRISRRQGGVGFGVGCPVIPALVTPLPSVVFVLDTSGSMCREQLAAGISETCAVLQACGSKEIDFLSCDHAVHAHGRVQRPQQLSRLVKGGGGSSFVPAFDHIARMRNKPRLAIFATDGDISVPEHAPNGLDVIWLLISAGHGADRKPTRAYGRHVVIEADGAE